MVSMVAGTPARSGALTVDDVLRMVDAGVLGSEDHVELLDGELWEMNAQGPVHSALPVRLQQKLSACFGDAAHVRVHTNVQLGERDLPEPDIAVVRGNNDDYLERLPRGDDLLLIVEISVTTQAHDRWKAGLYARAGVPEYWLLDVPGRTLTVHREPMREALPGKAGYASVDVLEESGVVSVPGSDERWSVATLLP